MKAFKNYFCLTIIFLCFSCITETKKEKILLVGEELTSIDFSRTNSSENIVFISNGLKEKVIKLKKQNLKIRFAIINGDLNYPFGNSKAENILILNNEMTKLNIRLKYNSEKMKFDILGYHTE